ncbi:hypothetical protein [Streptomyces djakartensis]|uniref:hypothetical protein n=1 Tax=Streptomyces djakartensis TaxID=68193 RepID=UPI0034DE5785
MTTDRNGGAGQPPTQPCIALIVREAATSGPGEPLHQENVVLGHASDERSARERAEARAREAQTG